MNDRTWKLPEYIKRLHLSSKEKLGSKVSLEPFQADFFLPQVPKGIYTGGHCTHEIFESSLKDEIAEFLYYKIPYYFPSEKVHFMDGLYNSFVALLSENCTHHSQNDLFSLENSNFLKSIINLLDTGNF